jgi:hypothetical protein
MRLVLRTLSLVAVVAAVAPLIVVENVPAQPNPPPSVAPAPRIKLTAEQEYIIREVIFEDANVQKQNSALDSIDDIVPDDVKLFPIPPDVVQKVPQVRSLMFFVKDDAVILVRSSDRRIADVIKKKASD